MTIAIRLTDAVTTAAQLGMETNIREGAIRVVKVTVTAQIAANATAVVYALPVSAGTKIVSACAWGAKAVINASPFVVAADGKTVSVTATGANLEPNDVINLLVVTSQA